MPEQVRAEPTEPPEPPPDTQPTEGIATTEDTAWPEQYQEFAKLDRTQQSTYQRQADKLIGLLTGRDTQGRWGVTIFILITAISFGYGAVHALMPGHAKTIVAAYLISQKGTYWHAVLLAIIVTITHTLLVVILGVVILIFQKTNPNIGNTLQMWLGVISGLLVAGMGFVLVWRAMRGRLGASYHHHHHHDEDLPWWRKLFTHSHPEVPAHDHHHHHEHNHHHEHPHKHRAADPGQELTLWTLLVLGVTGGIVPCPTATIIMLLGIGAGVVVGALYAVGVFSLGLALTLMMVGFMALSSRKAAARIMSDAQHEGELSTGSKRILLQIVPALSGAVVIALGCAIAVNYLWIMNTGNSLIKWLG
jgi:nickel/cobalt exporter